MLPPRPARYMCGRQALVVRKAPSRWIASIFFHSAKGNASIGWTIWMPALLTRMSTPPNSATTAAIPSLTAFSLLTSIATPIAAPLALRISPAVASAASSLRSAIATLAPSRAKRMAISLPMPLAAPVMMATLSLSFMLRSYRVDDARHAPAGCGYGATLLLREKTMRRGFDQPGNKFADAREPRMEYSMSAEYQSLEWQDERLDSQQQGVHKREPVHGVQRQAAQRSGLGGDNLVVVARVGVGNAATAGRDVVEARLVQRFEKRNQRAGLRHLLGIEQLLAAAELAGGNVALHVRHHHGNDREGL